MIKEASFQIGLKNSIKLLKELELFKSTGPKEIGNYSDIFKKVCRNNKHIEIYNTIRDNLDYEIVLSDDSFFQFSRQDDYLRFSYIQNPNMSMSKYDFLRACLPDENLDDLTQEDINEMVDENQYEQFLIEQEINSNLVYIRYDFDKKGYSPLLHSCSHIHMGLNENVRIPSSAVFTPLRFVMFCIKQCYYETWKIYHNSMQDHQIANKWKDSKSNCINISNTLYRTSSEEYEVSLS